MAKNSQFITEDYYNNLMEIENKENDKEQEIERTRKKSIFFGARPKLPYSPKLLPKYSNSRYYSVVC